MTKFVNLLIGTFQWACTLGFIIGGWILLDTDTRIQLMIVAAMFTLGGLIACSKIDN